MKRQQAFKFELRPNGPQTELICQFAGSRRFVYNKALDLQIECYACTGKKFTYSELCNILVEWKADPETAWLALTPSQSLQQTLKDLDRAYTNFFKGLAEFPTFKKKGKSRESFRYPAGFQIDANNARIFLPKLGWVRYFKSQEILGTPKNVTVSIAHGRCFVSIQTERDVPVPQAPEGPPLAFDEGITIFAAASDGRNFAPINAYKKEMKALAKAQKVVARRQKGGKNHAKAKRRVAKIHRKIANQRKDFLHKLSTDLCKNHAVIIIEDLQISNMSRSAKGTEEAPGKNVRQKAGLNRAILDQGWGMFGRMLEYKTAWNGGELIRVDPKHTSQKCPECHHVDKENRKTQAKFACVKCHYTANADFVGARNTLARGLEFITTRGHRGLACRDTSPIGASAQEPTIPQGIGA